MSEETYCYIGGAVGGITFIIAWIYCIASYGFLLGVGLNNTA